MERVSPTRNSKNTGCSTIPPSPLAGNGEKKHAATLEPAVISRANPAQRGVTSSANQDWGWIDDGKMSSKGSDEFAAEKQRETTTQQTDRCQLAATKHARLRRSSKQVSPTAATFTTSQNLDILLFRQSAVELSGKYCISGPGNGQHAPRRSPKWSIARRCGSRSKATSSRRERTKRHQNVPTVAKPSLCTLEAARAL